LEIGLVKEASTVCDFHDVIRAQVLGAAAPSALRFALDLLPVDAAALCAGKGAGVG